MASTIQPSTDIKVTDSATLQTIHTDHSSSSVSGTSAPQTNTFVTLEPYATSRKE